MNGSQLLNLLIKTGYNPGHELNGQALDWMFDNSQVSNLLEWICNEVDDDNILLDEEVSRCVVYRQASFRFVIDLPIYTR